MRTARAACSAGRCYHKRFRPIFSEPSISMARIQLVNAAQCFEFDTLLDVRSPAEFAEDHIPGAINVPVLDNTQRAQVGTLYTQVSPFEARKVGAALIARNIA